MSSLNSLILVVLIFILNSGCINMSFTDDNSDQLGTIQKDDAHTLETDEEPNKYGWSNSNCAHIMADGECAHPTGANKQDEDSENVNSWNDSNCAHIMADGTCAHKL